MYRFVLLGVLLGLLALPVKAQTTHTLEIRDGQVIVDGRIVPPEELPASLEVDAVTARFSFSGNAAPVVELGGLLYAVTEGTLREVERAAADTGGISVFFREEVYPSPARSPTPTAVREERREVQQDMRRYLEEVQAQNQELYNRLVREWQLEREVQALAAEVRSLPEDEARHHLDQLRDRLNEIFDLKQQNRHREIEQLERQLDALRERVQRREALRIRLIEQRLHDLTGHGTAQNE